MRFGRTLPPAASPIYLRDIFSGIRGCLQGNKETERFSAELREYFNVQDCFLVSSGKAALTLILQALKDLAPERDEVLIPAFTCYSVPSAILRAGLKIRLCDIDPGTLDFNFHDLRKYFQAPHNISRLLCVVPIHLFGLPADVSRLRTLIPDENILVVEDAAQSMGGGSEKGKLGTLGDVGFCSLGRGKALSTVEGGIVLTSREDIAAKIHHRFKKTPSYTLLEHLKLIINSVLLSIFQHPSLFWFPRLFPSLKIGETIFDVEFKVRKLTSFQAGLSRSWKSKLNDFQKKRRKRTLSWRSSLERKYIYELSDNYEVPALIRFPVKIDNAKARERVKKRIKNMGLGIMHTYPDSINKIKELKNYFHGQNFPFAEELSKSIITFPVHPFVSQRDIRKIKERLGPELLQS